MNKCLPTKLKTKAFLSKEKKRMNEILKEKDWCAAEGEKYVLHFLDEAEI